MPATTERIPFTGFQQGEYGKAASWQAGFGLYRQRLLYKGAFTSNNVLRSIDSSIIPRSGLVEVSPTGLPNGVLLGFVWLPVPGKTALAVIGPNVWRFDVEAAGSTAVNIGTFAITPTVPVAFAVDAAGITYASVYGDKTYVIDPTAGTVTALATSPGGQSICIHGESSVTRLVVANIAGGQGNQLYASTGGDYTNWHLAGTVGADPNFPAATINVGDAWPINAIFSQRTHLAVAKQQSWWVFTGGFNNGTLRPILRDTSRWPQTPGAAGMDGDDTIWFVPFFDDIPAVFDGAKLGENRTLSFNGGAYSQAALPPPFKVCRNLRHDEILLAAATTAGGPIKVLLRQEGLPTLHQLNVAGGFNGAWISPGTGGRIHCSDGGAAGAPPRFYTWRTHLDSRPPLSGSDLESNLDPTGSLATTFTLPEWWGRAGETISVRSVFVDLKRWNTGFSAHNHYDLSVVNLRQYVDQAATPYSQPVAKTATFDEATSAVPGGVGSSQQVRIQHNLDTEKGNGFQLTFSNLAGVAIQKVVVDLQVDTPRGL